MKNYCNLFSLSDKKSKKFRLLIQDFICGKQLQIAGKLGMWAASRSSERTIYVSFNFKCFYISDTGHNIKKIIVPIDIISYLLKALNLKKLFTLSLKKKKYQNGKIKKKEKIFNEQKKKVALITHRGLTYGSNKNLLFEKGLYYSDDQNSSLCKNNILHLDYDNFGSLEKNVCWVSLNKVKISKIKVFFKSFFVLVKTLKMIKNWPTFLGWLLCTHQYISYIKYCEIIKRFKNLKIALIDYEVLCPKTLIFALEKNNIKTISAQERFIHTFYTSFANVVVDTYYVASEFAANHIKKSKYYDVNNVIPVGLYRSDCIPFYKKETLPEEIIKEKKRGKKIIIALGFHSPNNWFESYTNPILNWTAQVNFLNDIIKLSENLDNTFIVLRYKTLEWLNSTYFKKILGKIKESKNIIISDRYESFYSYRLCAHADLVIAKHTSLADECLSKEIPVLFHEYTHNLEKITTDAFNYNPPGLMCYNFEELLEKSNSILFSNTSQLRDEIKTLTQKIYFVHKQKEVKNKILNDLEKYDKGNSLI